MRRLVAGFFLVGAAVLAAPAGAHALVRTSDPADGALLQKAPTQVTITFTEAPDPKLSSIHVLDSTGRSVERGQAVPVPGRPLELRVAVPTLPQGVYTVTWRAVSRVDGHVTAGSFSFGVGVSPAGAATPKGTTIAGTPSPPVLAVAGRWAFYWGLALLMGAAVVGSFVLRGLPRGGRLLLSAAWVLAAAGLVMMVAAERSAVGVSLAQLFRSGAGRQFIDRAVALGIVGVVVAVVLARPRWTTLPWVGVATAIAMVVHVRAGHAGAVSNAPSRWFDTGVQSVHVISVGVWVGGLAWLLLAASVMEGPERVAAVRRFSWLAGIALAVVAVTGALRAVSELGGVHAVRGLLHTSFGLTLIVKVSLFVVLVALGAFNRYGNVPGVTEGTRAVGSLRRTVAAEVLVAAGILGATGVLSELPPASTVAAAAARPAAAQQVVASGHDFATTVRVRLTATPGTIGPNRFEARITDYDTGKPVEATQVSLQFALPGRPDLGTPTLSMTRGAGGTWVAQGTVLSMDGRWNVTVVIQQPAGGVTVPLVLETRLPPEHITIARASGQPDVYTISLAGGRSLQSYVDPGKAGKNVVHFTFFQASGNEQPISSATATALTPSGTNESLPLIRFDAGHFAANTELIAGTWRFQIQATLPGGQVLSAYFTQQITS